MVAIEINPKFARIILRVHKAAFIIRRSGADTERGWRIDMSNPDFDPESMTNHLIQLAKSAQAIEKMVGWKWKLEDD